ncbi:putative ubiquitin-conjugating enzyme E2 38 [Forsythia ovata]
MVYIMRNPPKNFEIFVSQHFRKRADSILAAIQDYRVLVISSTSSKASCLFKYKLKHIHSELARAFGKVSELNSETDNGSQLSNRERKEKGHNVKKPKKGLMKKLISIAKWIWK